MIWEQGFLWEQTLLSVWKDILGSIFLFGTQHWWQLQQFVSKDEGDGLGLGSLQGKEVFCSVNVLLPSAPLSIPSSFTS